MSKLKIIFSVLFVLIITQAFSQEKKVAIITFYADKRVSLNELGLEFTANLLKLEEDPNFNLTPMLKSFHTQFFDTYSKNFPFKLAPEEEVINNAAYKAYVATDKPAGADARYVTIDGYKAINYNWGKENEKNLATIFNQYDGVMYVDLSFEFIKSFAIGGLGAVKVKAYAHMVLVDKNGKRIFNIGESAQSKKTSAMVGGIPVMQPDKVLPMCESALTELMAELDKRIARIIKKTDTKL
jgi:hypothetical protein